MKTVVHTHTHTHTHIHIGDLVKAKLARFSGDDWRVKEVIPEKSLVHLKNAKGLNFWVDVCDIQILASAN